jgi:hypothetical protein
LLTSFQTTHHIFDMSERFRTGETAPISGVYEVIDEDGTVLSRLPLAKGDHFPPYRRQGRVFTLWREVNAKYTAVASAAVMDETTADFAEALESLAKK